MVGSLIRNRGRRERGWGLFMMLAASLGALPVLVGCEKHIHEARRPPLNPAGQPSWVQGKAAEFQRLERTEKDRIGAPGSVPTDAA